MRSFQNYRDLLLYGDFSDVYLEDSRQFSLRWENGTVESVTESESSGLGVRILNGHETRFGHADLSNPFGDIPSVREAESLADLKKSLSFGLKTSAIVDASIPLLLKHPLLKPPEQLSIEEKMKLLERAFRAANTGPHIRQITINYGEKNKKVGGLNSKGESFLEERTYVVLSLTVTVERNKESQTAYEALGGLAGLELFDGGKVEALARAVSFRAHLKLDAPQAPVGSMPVVIASCAGGTLIHEAVGHSLEADAVLDGTSPAYRGKLGHVVANEKLTVYDNPTIPGARGSFYFDDEGTQSEASVLIENGVLKTLMYDRLTAQKSGRASNGHGRRESYAHRPIPRMSNTYIAPGKDDPQKIVDGFQNGLLVTRMGGGQVNTANGDFVFEVEEGFHVENGKHTMIRGATLLGNGPDILNHIDQVGSDHGWGIGTCGKEGQGVPVSDAIPTIHIQKLVVGGQ